MLTSMTGYGRAETRFGARSIVVEMRTVNHRYAEVVLRLPRELFAQEESLRKLVLEQVGRGRVEVYVTLTDTNTSTKSVRVDEGILQAALRLLREVSVQAQVDFDPPGLGELLAIPGLFVVAEDPMPVDDILLVLFETARAALEDLLVMRRTEGTRLYDHLSSRLRDLSMLCEHMKVMAPGTTVTFREKLAQRLQQVLAGSLVDADRMALEVAIVAERTSVEEELQRFSSHLEQFSHLLTNEQGPVGKKLDFLLQEMNREVNTIGAKCSDLDMTNAVLSAKHVLEQLREQAQNVE